MREIKPFYFIHAVLEKIKKKTIKISSARNPSHETKGEWCAYSAQIFNLICTHEMRREKNIEIVFITRFP